jgi:hypothetical protein
MRPDVNTCRDPDLLAAEVRRLNAVIAAGEMERVSQNSDCPVQDNAANADKVFPTQNMTTQGAAPAATAKPNPAGRDSDHVAGTGDIVTNAEREPSGASAGSQPVAWQLWGDESDDGPFDHYITVRAAHWDAERLRQENPSKKWSVVPLYRQPTLADAEREAIEWCVGMAETTATECDDELAALRGLLERTK